ncbi:ribbon-helix-helix protein, CopG family [Alkalicaulis satelles]|uniref:Ribbon-helix-helix protein, CopG family n=1 Tax=Alkalicaulis satelles TaxID=2609175 RepID=A0A5M6ZKM7_9PROT|nr:ribbon-helix-helix protein, CopG family [Alkalicaulis satelles]KAA5804880.1 ribbon-helix-helix protein, CopG family [Alkalicaulis satelles]
MKAHEFDAEFDDGYNVSEAIDWSNARRPNEMLQRISVDLPEWMIDALDRKARNLGMTREDLIRLWIGAWCL